MYQGQVVALTEVIVTNESYQVTQEDLGVTSTYIVTFNSTCTV